MKSNTPRQCYNILSLSTPDTSYSDDTPDKQPATVGVSITTGKIRFPLFELHALSFLCHVLSFFSVFFSLLTVEAGSNPLLEIKTILPCP